MGAGGQKGGLEWVWGRGLGSSVKGEENKILVATLAAKSSLFYIFTINYALVHIKYTFRSIKVHFTQRFLVGDSNAVRY